MQKENVEPIYSHGVIEDSQAHESVIRYVDVADRVWKLVFSQSQSDLNKGKVFSKLAITVLGALCSVLAAFIIGYLATTRQRVKRLAGLLTIDLQKTNKDLIQSNKDMAQFAFVASHDLQTPVRNVIMSVDLLEDALGDRSNPEVQEYMQFLRDSSQRMKTLIGDLLDYARIGHSDFEITRVDLNKVLKQVQTDSILEYNAANATLTFDTLPVVQGDELQLERVFSNLIINAIKYCRPGISPEIHVSVTSNPCQLKFQDNGRGIDDKFQEAIFEPFRRLHRQDDITGSGLGLAICQQIVERHGGSIAVESKAGLGSAFIISLPNSMIEV